MKQYIKDGKIYNLPIRIETDNGILYTTDDAMIKKYDYIEYVRPEYKPTVEELIEQSTQAINAITDAKILNDFVFKGAEFYLTMENQTNFANMFIAKDYLTYPQKVKTKTGYYLIYNADEVTEFYLAGVNFIKECLEAGWQQKDAEIEKINSES